MLKDLPHPLQGIASPYRSRIFWSLCLFASLLAGTLIAIGPFELFPRLPLAGTEARAQAILAHWQEQDRVRAAFNLGLDYLFLLTYSTTLALACLWAGETMRKCSWAVGRFGSLIAWAQWLEALCDATENAALIKMLLGDLRPCPLVARWSALTMFTLILLGVLYALGGVAAYFVVPRHGTDVT